MTATVTGVGTKRLADIVAKTTVNESHYSCMQMHHKQFIASFGTVWNVIATSFHGVLTYLFAFVIRCWGRKYFVEKYFRCGNVQVFVGIFLIRIETISFTS